MIGRTAPLVVFLYAGRKSSFVRRLVIVWNVMGLLLITNVAVHGILATPLVPLALALHVLSLRQQRRTGHARIAS